MELCKIQEKDLEKFLEMQIHTFLENSDSEGAINETIEDLREDYRIADFYMFLENDAMIGGASVFMIKEGAYWIQRFFIVPDKQNRHLGRQALRMLIDRYPWETIRLDTPVHHERNLHFYESFGFVRLCDKRVSDAYVLTELELRRNAL